MKTLGIRLEFSGLKNQVMRVFKKSGLVELLGSDAFYSDKETALNALKKQYAGLVNDPLPENTISSDHDISTSSRTATL